MHFNIYKLNIETKQISEIIEDFHSKLEIRCDPECTIQSEDEIGHKIYRSRTKYRAIHKFKKVKIGIRNYEVWSFYVNKILDGSPNWGKDFLKLSGIDKNTVHFEGRNNPSGGIFIRMADILSSNQISQNPLGQGRIFARGNINLTGVNIPNSSPSYSFLITWGDAWRLADGGKVEDFGIKVVANLIEENKILQLNAKEVSFNGRSVSSKIIRPGRFHQFKIDEKSESTSRIVGEYEISDHSIFKEKKLKRIRLEGSSSLSLGSSYFSPTIEELIDIVSKLDGFYYLEDYREKHQFLDNMEKIPRKSNLYNEILDKLVRNLASGNLEYLIDIEDADVMTEENFVIKNINSISRKNFDEIEHSYKTVDGEASCLKLSTHIRAQVQHDGKEYLYFNKDVYRIPDSVVESLDRELNRVTFDDHLIVNKWDKSKHIEELNYNQFVAEGNDNFKSLDQVFYRFDGVTKYEICDLFSEEGHIVHVKRDDGPASISHVCAQAFNSILPLTLNDEVKQDYEKIFSLKRLCNIKLNGEIVGKSYRNHRINEKFDKSKINHDKYKITLCLAMKNATSNSKEDILGMSYLRKNTLNSLCDKVLELGYEMVITTIQFSE